MSLKKYKKLDQLKHILHRSDTYVGSTRKRIQTMFISDDTKEFKIYEKEIEYSPAILRIFIEALSNAIDNVARSLNTETPCKYIKIYVDPESGRTSVQNDGDVIPVKYDEEEKCYIHSLIFGQLLTSSNYNDNEDRYDISGRNGIGIKATSVFSTYFNVEGVDPVNNKKFTQTWENNMSIVTEPIIKPSKKKGYTNVTWIPDFKRFGIEKYSKDIIDLYCKYVVDCAMLTAKNKVSIYFNDKKIEVNNLEKYAQLFFKETLQSKLLLKHNKDSVLLIPLLKGSQKQKHMSFVNGVYTKDGGTHVDAWSKQIFKPICDALNKSKTFTINHNELKKYFMIFVNVCLNRPEFESQSKNKLESDVKAPTIKDTDIKKILKWDIIDYVKRLKEITSLKKLERPKNNKFIKVDGFDPANNEGTSQSKDCTLILVEGLSAKTFAVQGIQSGAFGKEGRDWFGIYPLRGKLLNVRNAKTTSIIKNRVIHDIITILGISTSKDYTKEDDFKTIRYGRVMMLCDADVDGIHITGLIQNLFHFMYPTLLKRESPFLTSMQTPIVKVFLTGKKDLLFYNEELYKEYEKKHKNVKNKYYKGLGSSSQKDIREVFGKKLINFRVDSTTDDDMDKVFNKNCSDLRKEWLVQESKNGDINWNTNGNIEETQSISLSRYLNNEVKKFSINDCRRSIPHLMDGLKESQRKVLYACFLKKLNFKGKTLKVAQLAGFVAEKTSYHHGEQNLYDTITRMANDYVGSNNIPYLYRDGQFGTRIENGKDAANARYIFTKLDRLTRMLFRQEDDELLEHVTDDGVDVEPVNYVPIIPTILVNGCSSGIGTGWSSSIPSYNPKDLIQCMRAWIKNKEYPEIHPWYNNYKGEISRINDNKYVSNGVLERNIKKKNLVIVTELPIGMWTSDFKDKMYTLIEKKYIKCIKNYSTPTNINVHIMEDRCGKLCTIENLHLFKFIHTSNMVLFTKDGIRKFKNINEIMDNFCKERYELYIIRKKTMLSKIEKNIIILTNKSTFLTEIMNDTFKLFDNTDSGRVSRTIESMENEFIEKKYNMKYGYDYMIKMQFRNITKKSMDELKNEINSLKVQFEKIKSTSEKKMWLNDLKCLENSI